MVKYFHPNKPLESVTAFGGLIGGVATVGTIEDGYTSAHNHAEQTIQTLSGQIATIHGLESELGQPASQYLKPAAQHREQRISTLVAKEPHAPADTIYGLEGLGLGVVAAVALASAVRGISYSLYRRRIAKSTSA